MGQKVLTLIDVKLNGVRRNEVLLGNIWNLLSRTQGVQSI